MEGEREVRLTERGGKEGEREQRLTHRQVVLQNDIVREATV